MSRKVRRVPKDWQHPKKKSYNYEQGFEMESYQPMFDQPFGPEMERWYAEWKSWEAGTHPDKPGHDFPYWDWNGGPPDPAYYRPDWPEETRTHLMMYENTSEGTPISPAFETPEELAHWLADNGASAFGSETASYESWLRICRGGFAPGMIITQHADGIETIQNGVEAL